jgi:hypothetical protein
MATNDIVDRSIGTVSNTASVLMAASPGRTYLMIFNPSAIYMAFSLDGVVPSVNGSGVGGAGSVVLAPGQGIVLGGGHDSNNPPSNVVNIISASGSNLNVTAWERSS